MQGFQRILNALIMAFVIHPIHYTALGQYSRSSIALVGIYSGYERWIVDFP